jgi:hypothetical protein
MEGWTIPHRFRLCGFRAAPFPAGEKLFAQPLINVAERIHKEKQG